KAMCRLHLRGGKVEVCQTASALAAARRARAPQAAGAPPTGCGRLPASPLTPFALKYTTADLAGAGEGRPLSSRSGARVCPGGRPSADEEASEQGPFGEELPSTAAGNARLLPCHPLDRAERPAWSTKPPGRAATRRCPGRRPPGGGQCPGPRRRPPRRRPGRP